MKYLGKMDYRCKIVTPDGKTQREIVSDKKIKMAEGDYVTVDGTDYMIHRIEYKHNFDEYTQTCIVYLE